MKRADVSQGVMRMADDDHIARVAHALGHPARVRILRLLAAQDACRGAEVFESLPLAQSTVSQHIAVLKEAGLVHATPHGTSMLYCISPEPLYGLASEITALIARSPACSGKEAK